MSSGGGGVNYVAYDPSSSEAAMTAERTKIQDESTYNSYLSALNAQTYADQNLGMLREGLGFLQTFLESQRKELQLEQNSSSNLARGATQKFTESAKAGASAVTSNLLSYIAEANANSAQDRAEVPY